MAKHTAWLHIDLAGLEGDQLTHTLLANRDALRDLGHKTPVHSLEEGRHAWLEMLRLHKQHGVARKVVEGSWAEICRKAWKGKKVALLSVPGFGAAEPEQVALILDIAHGIALHVVVTVPVATTPEKAHLHDLAISRWEARLKPGRVHRVPVAPGDWETAWRELTALAGIDAGELQWGCQASSSAVREVTASGSSRPAS